MKRSSSYSVRIILACSMAAGGAPCPGCFRVSTPAEDALPDDSFLEQAEDDAALPDGDDIIDGDDSSDVEDAAEDAREDLPPPLRAWHRRYGTPERYESFQAIDPTADGGFIAAGYIADWPFDPYGPQELDFLVVKLDLNGEIEWQERIGGSEDDSACCAEQTEDGGFIVAGDTLSFRPYSTAGWIVKLDSSGSIEWQRAYYNVGITSLSVRHTSDGGYIATGTYYTYYGLWLSKLNESGDIVWQKSYEGEGLDATRDIRQTEDGGFIVTGSSNSFSQGAPLALKVDPMGEVEWAKAYSRSSGFFSAGAVIPTSDGGYILSAFDRPDGPPSLALLAVKTDSLGNIIWHQDYGPAGSYEFPGILQAADGGYLLTAWEYSSTDTLTKLLAIKIYPEGYDRGYIEWQKRFDSPLDDIQNCAAEVPSGGYVIAGDDGSAASIAGQRDAWVIKIDENGGVASDCLPGFGEDSSMEQFFPYLTAEDAELTEATTNLLVEDTDAVPQATDLVVWTECASN